MKAKQSAGKFLTLALALGLTASAAYAQSAGQDMKNAGGATKDAAVSTGHATKKVAKKTGRGTKKVAVKTADGTETVAKKTGHVAKVGAKKTVSGAKAVGRGTENLGDKIAGKPATH